MEYRKASSTHYIGHKFFCRGKTNPILKIYISGERREPTSSLSYPYTVTSLIIRVQSIIDFEVITDFTATGMIYTKQQERLCFDSLDNIHGGYTRNYYRTSPNSPLANLTFDPTYIKIMQGNSIIRPQEDIVYKVTSTQLYISPTKEET